MRHGIKFRGFHVGPVIASALIAVGVEDVLKVLSWPLAVALTGMMNQISKAGRLGIPILDSPRLPLILGVSGTMTGAILVVLGFWLASWLHGEST